MPFIEKVIGGTHFVCKPIAETGVINASTIIVVICIHEDGSDEILDSFHSGETVLNLQEHPKYTKWMSNCKNGKVWVCVHAEPSKEKINAFVKTIKFK